MDQKNSTPGKELSTLTKRGVVANTSVYIQKPFTQHKLERKVCFPLFSVGVVDDLGVTAVFW